MKVLPIISAIGSLSIFQSVALAEGGACLHCSASKVLSADTNSEPTYQLAGDMKKAEAEAQTPRFYAVKVHADWCGTCKAIGPEFTATEKAFSEEPIGFFVLDLTDKDSREASFKTAKKLKIDKSLKELKKTGQVAIIDTKTGKVVELLKGRKKAKDYTVALKSQIDKSKDVAMADPA